MNDAKELAREFSKVLLHWIGPEYMRRVIEKNSKQEDKNICHSHDFCDANMAMDEAFNNILKRSPLPDDLDEGMTDETMQLWNAAWDLAKERKFYFNLNQGGIMEEGSTKHFGEIQMKTVGSFATIILKVAPLKYYDPDRDPEDKDDKEKADVVFSYINDKWQMIKWFPVEEYEGKETEIYTAVMHRYT